MPGLLSGFIGRCFLGFRFGAAEGVWSGDLEGVWDREVPFLLLDLLENSEILAPVAVLD